MHAAYNIKTAFIALLDKNVIYERTRRSKQGHRKRWTGFETAITYKVLEGFTRFAS